MTFRMLTLRAREETADTLVIALPGLQVTPEDFVARGLVAALQARVAADVTALAIDPNDYFERDFTSRLRNEILLPARDGGYARIVILALSLGALGALRYAERASEDLDGLILLAPFLGNPGTIAEVERAGGLGAWIPAPLSRSDIERPGLLWLKSHTAGAPARPWLHLGFGTEDRFRAGARLLAASLPPDCITALPGDHDWPTWARLWQAMLDHLPLTKRQENLVR